MSANPVGGGRDESTAGSGTSRRRFRRGLSRATARQAPRLFLPQGYEPGYAYPLVVWLPGARRFDLGRAMQRLSTRNYLAVEPAFAAGDDVYAVEEAVFDAIHEAVARGNVHPDRVFLVGRGAGGTDAFRIACRHAERFAGMVSLGGAFPHAEALFARLAAVRRLPFLLCCRRDAEARLVATTATTLRLFHAAGAQLSMRIYEEPNDLAPAILRDVNRWLMEGICGPTADVGADCPA
ncbi:MAG: hypothetical protein ACKO9B_01905 [Planctomycetota bacterium]